MVGKLSLHKGIIPWFVTTFAEVGDRLKAYISPEIDRIVYRYSTLTITLVTPFVSFPETEGYVQAR